MRFEDRIAPIRGSHLSDDQLMETYVLAGENRHLGSCRQCAARFDDLVRTLHHVHEAAVREADSAFDADRLHDQRERIMRRIERHDHPAEVVAFPHRTSPHPAHRFLGPARRWVAGAAAAGLAAGMFLGFAMDRRMHYVAVNPAVQQSPAGRAVAVRQGAEAHDEQLLNEVDDMLVGSRVREMRPDLSAIDVMTTPVEIAEVSYLR